MKSKLEEKEKREEGLKLERLYRSYHSNANDNTPSICNIPAHSAHCTSHHLQHLARREVLCGDSNLFHFSSHSRKEHATFCVWRDFLKYTPKHHFHYNKSGLSHSRSQS